MIDFTEYKTPKNTMTAQVILTFDSVIDEFGTQAFFDVEFEIARTGEETVFNMLTAINENIDLHDLPKKDLWKISTSANWTKIATEHGLNIQLIYETNGKWQFGWKEQMTNYELLLEQEFQFGQNVHFTIEYVQQTNMRIYEQMLKFKSKHNSCVPASSGR